VKEVSEAEFEASMIEATRPVLVQFYAPWCGPCRTLAPTVERMAEEFHGRIDFLKVNVDRAPNLTARYGVRSVPTLMVFHRGESRDSMVGLVSAAKLKARLEPFAALESLRPVALQNPEI
jgi:thioredoxin 1